MLRIQHSWYADGAEFVTVSCNKTYKKHICSQFDEPYMIAVQLLMHINLHRYIASHAVIQQPPNYVHGLLYRNAFNTSVTYS